MLKCRRLFLGDTFYGYTWPFLFTENKENIIKIVNLKKIDKQKNISMEKNCLRVEIAYERERCQQKKGGGMF